MINTNIDTNTNANVDTNTKTNIDQTINTHMDTNTNTARGGGGYKQTGNLKMWLWLTIFCHNFSETLRLSQKYIRLLEQIHLKM